MPARSSGYSSPAQPALVASAPDLPHVLVRLIGNPRDERDEADGFDHLDRIAFWTQELGGGGNATQRLLRCEMGAQPVNPGDRVLQVGRGNEGRRVNSDRDHFGMRREPAVGSLELFVTLGESAKLSLDLLLLHGVGLPGWWAIHARIKWRGGRAPARRRRTPRAPTRRASARSAPARR